MPTLFSLPSGRQPHAFPIAQGRAHCPTTASDARARTLWVTIPSEELTYRFNAIPLPIPTETIQPDKWILKCAPACKGSTLTRTLQKNNWKALLMKAIEPCNATENRAQKRPGHTQRPDLQQLDHRKRRKASLHICGTSRHPETKRKEKGRREEGGRDGGREREREKRSWITLYTKIK